MSCDILMDLAIFHRRCRTLDAFFRLATMLIRINVVDCHMLEDFHQFINYTKKSEEKKIENGICRDPWISTNS